MSWMMQILGFGLFLIGVVIALWVSVWVLLALFIGMTGYVLFVSLRDYLVDKGILNPTPGVPIARDDEERHITIVDADFTRVEEEPKQ